MDLEAFALNHKCCSFSHRIRFFPSSKLVLIIKKSEERFTLRFSLFPPIINLLLLTITQTAPAPEVQKDQR